MAGLSPVSENTLELRTFLHRPPQGFVTTLVPYERAWHRVLNGRSERYPLTNCGGGGGGHCTWFLLESITSGSTKHNNMSEEQRHPGNNLPASNFKDNIPGIP